ncbi:MAG: glycosyltransferase family 2 protein [Acidimicrobiales bacterium]
MSVVIPTYNRCGSLGEVISPVLADPCTGEIVVVVDGSRDGSLELLQEWAQREPRIRAVFQENAGEGSARQLGTERARFDVVVYLDDDVIAGDGLISGHASRHADNARRLVQGYMPTRVPSPRRPGQSATFLYARDYENTCRMYEADPRAILTHLWAGNLSLRRRDALEVGLVRPPALRYHEDARLGLRCRDAGLEATFDRELLAWHRHQRDLNQFVAECRRSGAARARLVAEYPQQRDDIDPLAGLSAPVRLATRLLSAAGVRGVVAPLAQAASSIFGRLRAWPLEDLSARVLRQVVLYSAYRGASGA